MEPRRQLGRSRLTKWLYPIALLLFSWVWVAVLVAQARPGADVVAAVFPPWWTTERSLAAAAAAGASIVRAGGLSSILVVRPADLGGVERLNQAGAWFMIDPKAVGACFTI
jgi:hypothetical protein